jgi:X-X-X-Leu-X-X-Gly heptad repeat protein
MALCRWLFLSDGLIQLTQGLVQLTQGLIQLTQGMCRNATNVEDSCKLQSLD